ncbi:DUF559 domain-containing protein [Curtobacterium sp. RRHDQ10]|uniref:DUF559 domain-containing protein n=1 Tax=Curtobacterium phyllosphaerae TaxID=3413379 RepID=UPI003BF3C4A6
METITRLAVVDRGLPEPELNVAVFDDTGTFLGRPDMVYRAARVAIEYDGDHHRTDRGTWQHDASRSNGFVVNGWTVLHVTARDVAAPDDFLRRLAQALRGATRPAA